MKRAPNLALCVWALLHRIENGRTGEVRTRDLHTPSVARYQAALRSAKRGECRVRSGLTIFFASIEQPSNYLQYNRGVIIRLNIRSKMRMAGVVQRGYDFFCRPTLPCTDRCEDTLIAKEFILC
jgi:hypothetical protein